MKQSGGLFLAGEGPRRHLNFHFSKEKWKCKRIPLSTPAEVGSRKAGPTAGRVKKCPGDTFLARGRIHEKPMASHKGCRRLFIFSVQLLKKWSPNSTWLDTISSLVFLFYVGMIPRIGCCSNFFRCIDFCGGMGQPWNCIRTYLLYFSVFSSICHWVLRFSFW